MPAEHHRLGILLQHVRQHLGAPVALALGVGIVQETAVDGAIDHGVGDHYHIAFGVLFGEGLEVRIQPLYALLGIDDRIAAVGSDGEYVAAADHAVPASEIVPHFLGVDIGQEIVRAENLVDFLRFFVGAVAPFMIDVVVADCEDHRHFLGAEHALIEGFPVVELGVFLNVPGRAVRKVSHHDHTVEAAEPGGIIPLLDQGAAELVGGHGVAAVDVSVADDREVEDHLARVEIFSGSGAANEQHREQNRNLTHF